MCQTSALRRIVRDDLSPTAVPHLDALRIEAYLYEMVAELSDFEAMAFLDGLELLEKSGEPNAVVQSVVSRITRLIECDVILSRWQ